MRQSSESTHRSFYALTFPGEINESVVDLITSLRSHDNGSVHWTPPHNLHLTLRFLGSLDTARFRKAGQLMAEPGVPSSFILTFGRVNAFPSLRKARVLVLELAGKEEQDQKAFKALQSLTESFARELGLEPEDRRFRPHLTLGRVRRTRTIPQPLRNACEDIAPAIPDTRIDRFLLMESFLSNEGARYRIAEKQRLPDSL